MRQLVITLMAWSALSAAAHGDTLAGKVVEDHTGNPLASVEVKIFRTGSRYLAADLETDPEGKFEAAGLPAGEYRVEAAKANYVTSTVRPRPGNGKLLVRLVRCGVIAGQVSGAQGEAIPGATVYALPKPTGGGPFRPFAQTGLGSYGQVNAHGQYRLFNLPPGEYAVAVTYGASTMMVGSTGSARLQPGIGSGTQLYPVSTRPQIFAISGGEEYANIDFSIAPGALFNVSGKVDPAPGPGVFWVALTPVDSPAFAVAVAQTERDGTFKLEMVPPGSYQISAAGPSSGRSGLGAMMNKGALFGRSHLDVGGDVEGVAIAPQKGRAGSVVVRVEASKDTPPGACPAAAEVMVAPLEDWAAYLNHTVPVSVGQPQTLDELAPAHYRVTARKLGESCYQTAEAMLDLTGSAATPATVTVAPAGSIHGKLAGAAVAADWTVALVASDPEAAAAAVEMAFPDGDGKFTFSGLRPGRYRIGAQAASGGPGARWVSGAGQMLEVQVAAGAPTEIEVRVKVQQ